jgi:polynucleotide 5'-hydroxyl-kinase GRC3/NOL9
MISAVAARKAALASLVPISSGKGGEASTGPSPVFNRPDQTSKRKPSQKVGNKPKKARKSKPFDRSNLRTGVLLQNEVDISRGQHDVVVVNSDEDDRARKGDFSTLEDTADDADDIMAEPASCSFEKDSSNPPLDDSSGNEDDIMTMDAGMQLDVSTLLPRLSALSRAQEGLEEEKVLSTFQPQPDNNIFFLSESECSSLGLTCPSSLVCMTKEDTLCLLGICRLKVLRGLLNFFGATLQASPTVYHVYSSRYSPLPIFQPGNDCPSSILLDEQIPHRLRHVLRKFDAVFALQRLDSGVERLGEICRSFQGMFEPSRWQKNNTCSPFAIHNLCMVRTHPIMLYLVRFICL